MVKSQSNVARFKREVYKVVGPRVKFDDNSKDGDTVYMRVSSVTISVNKARMLVPTYGEDIDVSANVNWPKVFGEKYGFKFDGWDEEGNACWFMKMSDYLEPDKVA